MFKNVFEKVHIYIKLSYPGWIICSSLQQQQLSINIPKIANLGFLNLGPIFFIGLTMTFFYREM